jgi:rhodanese-related sulfurtransferase
MPIQQIAPQQLKEWLDDPARDDPLLLDVREDWELQVCRLPQVRHLPMNTVPARASELDATADIVVICHHGGRSLQVASWLASNGFGKLHNLAGGMDSWARQVDPSMAVY